MGAQSTKVQSSMAVLRGTPVEVYSKSEGRWVKAVIGAPKDVRESPPDSTAVLCLFQETVGGRNDAYKWVKCDEVPQYIRARPESKRQAGLMDTVTDTNFGTMYENRSAFEQRGTAPTSQFASLGVMGTIPKERPLEEPQGVMSSIMASVGLAPAASMVVAPSAMASMASTIDQNASVLQQRQAGYPTRSVPMASCQEERPGFMQTIMSAGGSPTQGFDPNVHAAPTMANVSQHDQSQGGVMASLMGMGGGLTGSRQASMMESRQGSVMQSHNGSMASMTSMVAYSENKSPNATPMGSVAGKMQAPAPNPLSSFMSSMGFMEPEPKAVVAPTMRPRARA